MDNKIQLNKKRAKEQEPQPVPRNNNITQSNNTENYKEASTIDNTEDKNKQKNNKKTQIPTAIPNQTSPNNEDEIEENEFFYLTELEVKKRSNISSDYFNTRQAYITPQMRSILCDWIMQISFQLGFKRETFHLSVTLLDVSLSKLPNLRANKLQLVGVTCLLIAAKFEEISCPNVNMYVYSTGGAYNSMEIVNFEQFLLNSLGWSIKYPTLSMWVNLITSKWDVWVESHLKNTGSHQIFKFLPLFRVVSSLNLIQKVLRCIDFAVFDCDYLNFDAPKLISGILYLVVGTCTGAFTEEFIENSIKTVEDLSNFDQFYNLNIIFDLFLNDYLGISLYEVSDCIVECALLYTYTKVAAQQSLGQVVSVIYIYFIYFYMFYI